MLPRARRTPGLGAPPEGREGAGYDTTRSRRQTPTSGALHSRATRATRCCREAFWYGPGPYPGRRSAAPEPAEYTG
jgi:hypothetical protein